MDDTEFYDKLDSTIRQALFESEIPIEKITLFLSAFLSAVICEKHHIIVPEPLDTTKTIVEAVEKILMANDTNNGIPRPSNN